MGGRGIAGYQFDSDWTLSDGGVIPWTTIGDESLDGVDDAGNLCPDYQNEIIAYLDDIDLRSDWINLVLG
jgi:hypothetical protein